jgi:hypothetical protein
VTNLVDRKKINSPLKLQAALFCLLGSSLNPKGQPNIWMKLTQLPHPFAHDEALLLCQHSPTAWVVWIPDYGEAIIDIA